MANLEAAGNFMDRCQCPGQILMTENYPAQNITSAEIEKP